MSKYPLLPLFVILVIFLLTCWCIYFYYIDPVDVVFTWYSPVHETEQEKDEKRKWKIMENIPVNESDSVRYTDCGELKYAIRSVYLYMPWVRNIFLVVHDKQVLPKWINKTINLKDHNFHIVRHSEIFRPHQATPSYNSCSIESVLHRIPGLAEKFIYFNDDFFCIRPVSKSYFFTWSGKSIIHFEQWSINLNGSNLQAYQHYQRNAVLAVQKVCDNKSGRTIYNEIAHFPKSFTKSQCYLAEEMMPKAFKLTRMNHFRNITNSHCVHTMIYFLSLCNGLSVSRDTSSGIFINLNESDEKVRSDLYEKILYNRTKKFLCLNNSVPGDEEYIRDVCMIFVPNKSPIEIPDRVVVTFTTIPSRMEFLPQTVKNIYKQTYNIDKIYVNIPYVSKRLQVEYIVDPSWEFPDNVQIVRCKDYGPATKVLGCLPYETNPETMIISIDDDHEYLPDAVETLVDHAKRNENSAIAFHCLSRYPFKTRPKCNRQNIAKGNGVFLLEGFGGVLYRRKFFVPEMVEYFENLSNECFLSDDVVISAWLEKQGIEKIMVCAKERPKINNEIDANNPLHDEDRKNVYDKCVQEMQSLIDMT